MSEQNRAQRQFPTPPPSSVEVRPGVWQIPPIEVFRMWPKKLRAKQDEQLSAPAIDINDAKAVLTRFRERLDDWDSNLSLGDRLTKEGVELGASPEDRKRVHEAVSTLLFQQMAELNGMLNHVCRHVRKLGVDTIEIAEAIVSPEHENIVEAIGVLSLALARLELQTQPAAPAQTQRAVQATNLGLRAARPRVRKRVNESKRGDVR